MPRVYLGQFHHFSSHDCTYYKLYNKGYFKPKTHDGLGSFPVETLMGQGYSYPEAGIYEISNGYCFAGTDRIYLSSGRLLGRLGANKNRIFSSLKRPAPQATSYLDGTLLHVSLNGLENNFYHFNVEYLARLLLFFKSGLKADYYLVPNGLSFQRELHEIVGLDSERILAFESGQLVTAKKILVPTFINNYISYSANGFKRYDKIWLPHWLKDAYRLVGSNLAATHEAPYIYISRDMASYRKVTNEEEVAAFLAKQGFRKVCLEKMSLSAQIRLFMGAKRIVSPHGAGLVNMSWCRQPAHILEIYPSRYSDPSFRLQADLLGHHYSFMRSHYLGDPSTDPQRMNLIVDIDLLREWLIACDNL